MKQENKIRLLIAIGTILIGLGAGIQIYVYYRPISIPFSFSFLDILAPSLWIFGMMLIIGIFLNNIIEKDNETKN